MRKLLALAIGILITGQASARDLQRELDSVMSHWESLAKFSGSVIVAQHGKIILNKGYGVMVGGGGQRPYDRTLYLIGESTEMFTSALIFKLQEDGKLSVNDTIGKYIPEMAGFGKITIKDLLTHRSGLHDYFYDETFQQGSIYTPRKTEDIIAAIKSMPLAFDPGTTYKHSFSNFYLLGLVAAKASGKTYYEALQKQILQPAGIRDAGFNFGGLASWEKAQGYSVLNTTRMVPAFPSDSTATASAAGMYTSATSMYSWAHALLAGKVLKRTTWQTMTNELGNNYAHGWETFNMFGKTAVGHTGEIMGFVNEFYVIPEDSTVIILLSNDFESETDLILETVVSAVYEQPYKLPAARIPVFLEYRKLEQYEGRYEFEGGADMNVFIKEKQLWGDTKGQEEFTMVADAKPDEFYMISADVSFKFERDRKTNLVTHIIIRQNRKEIKGRKWQ